MTKLLFVGDLLDYRVNLLLVLSGSIHLFGSTRRGWFICCRLSLSLTHPLSFTWHVKIKALA